MPYRNGGQKRERAAERRRSPLISAQRLRELVEYNPIAGEFTKVRKANNRWTSGRKLGWFRRDGYHCIVLDGRQYLAHRLAWLWMTGEWPAVYIDHVDGDPRNNRWTNLRSATHQQNIQNQKLRNNNKSGVRGVGFDVQRQKWRAQIQHSGKHYYLGRFHTKDDAEAAYREAALHHFGEFARLA